nr:nitrogenase-stabilizing/protective protein NifW [uncultured Enterobacter sp.]
MQWFYQIPGVNALDGATAFFDFFAVDYDTDALQRRRLLVLSDFHRRLQDAVPLRNQLDLSERDDWALARRLLSESYRQLIDGDLT